MKFLQLFALAALSITSSLAHTWVEEYQVIDTNGTYIGDRGYTRGYVARTDPTFMGDANILYMVPPLAARNNDTTVRIRINSTDPVCHPNQRTSNYTNPLYPRLSVAPGDFVAMKYLENGHVTLPWNQKGKPKWGGTVFVYGTTQPADNEMIANVLAWNNAGTGGNGKGFLMTAQNYDDGRCHQINDCVLSAERQVLFPNMIPSQPTSPGQEQWCETDLKIPDNQAAGTLTTYWVWQWPTGPDADCNFPGGKDEYYTTCADFDVMPAGPGDQNKIVAETATNTLIQENFQTQAVPDYASRTALTTSAAMILWDWSKTVGSTDVPASTFLASCSAMFSSEQAVAATAGPPRPTLPPLCPSDKWATGALFASVSSAALASASLAYTPTTFMPVPSMTSVPSMQPTAPYANSSSSAAVVNYSSSASAVYIQTVTTIETVTEMVSVYATSTLSSASLPEVAIPTLTTVGNIAIQAVPTEPIVGASGMVEDAELPVNESKVNEHMARHAHAYRRYARHF